MLVVMLGVCVAAPAPRELGSNLIRPLAFDIVLDGGAEVCQPVEHVPAGTAGVELRIGTYGRPGPRLRARITASGAPTAVGSRPGGWREGDVVAPVEELRRPRDHASVCLRNDGRERIALAGHRIGSAETARVDGRPAGSNVRVEYVRDAGGSWIGRAGFVADRVAAVRVVFPGAATLWLWVALALTVIGGAVAVVLREARP